MLIGPDGIKLGLLTLDEAIAKSQEVSLDVVQVSPQDADPIVCKLMDYGKHIFEKKKNSSSSKSKVKKHTTKEIKFRPSTDIGLFLMEIRLK